MDKKNKSATSFLYDLNFLKILTTRRLIIICFLGIIFWIGLGVKMFEPDIWRHLATGRYILENRAFPQIEVFSYTALSKSWIAYSWLAEIIFFKISLLGINWLIILRVFLITVVFGIILKTVYNRTGNFNLAVLISFIIIVSFGPSWEERPQLFSFVFTGLFTYILSEYKYRNKDYLWVLPFIMLFWVNLHIYFIIGWILIALYVIGEYFRNRLDWSNNPRLSPEQIRKLVKILLVCIVVSFLNPYTYRIFFQAYEFVTMGATAEVAGEMRSPSFHLSLVFLFEILMFIAFLSFICSPRRPDFTEWCIFFGFTHQSFYALRNMPFWGIVTASIYTPYLNDVINLISSKFKKKFELNSSGKDEPQVEGLLKKCSLVFNWVFLCGLIIIINLRVPYSKEIKSCVQERSYPIQAVEFIKENKLPGPMFNSLLWGSYLIYMLYPEYKVAFDGRTQVYGDKLLQEYCDVQNINPGWQDVLEKYKVNFILWRREKPLTQILIKDTNWELIYQDEWAVIFIKKTENNKKIIERFGQQVLNEKEIKP